VALANLRGINHLVIIIIIIKGTHKNAKWRKPPSCFCKKNAGIGHAFYFKASFHTEEILNESRRHLEFWSNDVHTIYFLMVVYCTYVALF